MSQSTKVRILNTCIFVDADTLNADQSSRNIQIEKQVFYQSQAARAAFNIGLDSIKATRLILLESRECIGTTFNNSPLLTS